MLLFLCGLAALREIWCTTSVSPRAPSSAICFDKLCPMAVKNATATSGANGISVQARRLFGLMTDCFYQQCRKHSNETTRCHFLQKLRLHLNVVRLFRTKIVLFIYDISARYATRHVVSCWHCASPGNYSSPNAVVSSKDRKAVSGPSWWGSQQSGFRFQFLPLESSSAGRK